MSANDIEPDWNVTIAWHPATNPEDIVIPYPTYKEVIPAGTSGLFAIKSLGRNGHAWGIFKTEGNDVLMQAARLDIDHDKWESVTYWRRPEVEAPNGSE